MSTNSSPPVQRLGVAVHPHYRRAQEALEKLTSAAERHGITIVSPDDDCKRSTDKPCQAVASIGGDGTLLSAVRRAYPADLPVWGINVGRLGFLTTCGLDDIEPGVERLARGAYTVEHRAMIAAEVKGGASETPTPPFVALNDVVIHRQIKGGLLRLDAELNGRYLATYQGDGLIIATPTGSTAYSLSAGGAILSPDLSAFIIMPICAHSLSARGLVVDDSSVLVVRPRLAPDDVVHVTADGQPEAVLKAQEDLPEDGGGGGAGGGGCEVVLRRADRDARLVRFDEVIFSDVLRDKLGWAGHGPVSKTE